MVFHDPTAGQATPAHSQALPGSHGSASFDVQGRTMNATAILSGLSDAFTGLIVTTTVGIEETPCFEASGAAYCIGTLICFLQDGGEDRQGRYDSLHCHLLET
jgi:hypothetical protein